MTWWASFSRIPLFTPNALSILRGILGAILPFLILRQETHFHLIAFAIFVLGGITDYWDGKMARALNMQSLFGKIADPTMDKILILAPLAAFCALDFFSVVWIIPIVIREILVTFCRIGWYMEGKAVGAERGGKIKFVFQVLAAGFGFFYIISLDYPFLTPFAGGFKMFMMIFIVIALLLTLWSGATFLFRNRENFRSPFFARYVAAAGVGLIPLIPGTWGSAVGLAIFLLARVDGWLCFGSFLFVVAAGYWAVSRINLSEQKDPQFVVVDEVAGIFITFLGIPISWTSLVVGFFLFRLFDVWKPYPLRRLENLPHYWGILADDLGAGVYSWLVMLILFR